jgi:uncharacterized protein (TIGR02453 family)
MSTSANNIISSYNFLSNLAENNTRDWFAANKNLYEAANSNFLNFTNSLIAAIGSFDKNINSIDAKDCVFRIYRDVRFSHDKSPYKTNMGAYIARGGRKSQFAGYYFHLQPNESFLSGGIYMAQPQIMRRVREEIVDYSEKFLEIIEHSGFKSSFSSLGEDSLKRVPQGFNSNPLVTKYLILKHITPHHNLTINDLSSPLLLDYSISIFKEMFPLIEFLNNAIEDL